MSYSHEHDAVLAPALQTDLERFSKPWYRTRALRIFRDTTNLTANLALRPSIEDALGSSQWFILLASPTAAKSEWVGREVQWWLEHKSPDHLIVVGTAPDLAWEEKTGTWAASSPVPEALRSAFTDEPIWVDLSKVPLNDGKPIIPDERLAAVAAPIRDKEPDKLVGEHVRLHRRAMRLAGGAVTLLTILTALAITAGFLAYGQRNNAIREKNTAIQERNTAIRERNQAIANQVNLEVGSMTATDPSLAARLDVVANQLSTTPDSETALLNTASAPLPMTLTGPTDVVSSVAFSRDGILAAASGDHKVRLWSLTHPASPVPLGAPLTGPTDYLRSVAFSPDGRTLAAAGDDHKVWLWNLTDPAHPAPIGTPLTVAKSSVTSVSFSPDGRTLAAASHGNVWLWNFTNPAHPAPIGTPLTGPAGFVNSVAFSPDGRTLAAGGDDDKVLAVEPHRPGPPRLARRAPDRPREHS